MSINNVKFRASDSTEEYLIEETLNQRRHEQTKQNLRHQYPDASEEEIELMSNLTIHENCYDSDIHIIH